MKRICVFASGSGSNFQAIVEAVRSKKIKGARVVLLVVDRKDAYVRVRAERLKIPQVFVNPLDFLSRRDYEKHLLKVLRQEKIDIVVLAGYMRILSPYFVRNFKNKILNIHPALLPAFKGTHAIERAYKYGVKVTGVTVHFVDDKVDHGPIILQEPVKVDDGDTLEDLERKIHKVEHRLYPQAINLLLKNKLKLRGRKVFIRGG